MHIQQGLHLCQQESEGWWFDHRKDYEGIAAKAKIRSKIRLAWTIKTRGHRQQGQQNLYFSHHVVVLWK